MKKIFSVTIILIFCQLNSIFSQNNSLKFGVKLGINSLSLKPDALVVANEGEFDELKLRIKNGNYGFHFGIQLPLTFERFMIQPELVFNSNSVDYEYTELSVISAARERYHYLDIPLLLGYKLGFLRLTGGPVGHIFLNSKSELFEISGYKEKFDNITIGFQTGLGITISRFTIDVRYEGNFQKFGSHISFDDQSFQFDTRPQRMLISLGLLF